MERGHLLIRPSKPTDLEKLLASQIEDNADEANAEKLKQDIARDAKEEMTRRHQPHSDQFQRLQYDERDDEENENNRSRQIIYDGAYARLNSIPWNERHKSAGERYETVPNPALDEKRRCEQQQH